MTRKATAADYGLVGTVGGLIVTVLVGMLTLGVSAMLGRIPLFLLILLSASAAATIVSIVMLISTRDRSESS